ncbi:MAG: Uma2 family endonuclease [Pseudonocardiaceae bacterium]
MASPAHTDLLDHAGPWSEAEFLALPRDRRVELLDGSLLMSPAGSGLHQWLSSQLWAVLNVAAPGGMRVLEAVNVRVAPGRILIPDVCVLADPDLSHVAYPASGVRLVAEITSPGNLATDRAIKPQLYAQAGIPHYLRIEVQRGKPTALVFALGNERYVETARFVPGETTHLTEPFPVSFDLTALVRS